MTPREKKQVKFILDKLCSIISSGRSQFMCNGLVLMVDDDWLTQELSNELMDELWKDRVVEEMESHMINKEYPFVADAWYASRNTSARVLNIWRTTERLKKEFGE